MTRFFQTILTGACGLLLAGQCAYSQVTTINLGAQSRNVDFSAAAFTKPVKTGANLPATCATGEMYFWLGAPAGQNLYGCVSQNVWTPMSSGAVGGGSPNEQFQIVRTSDSMLTINPNCSASQPCNNRIGSAVTRFTTPATITLAQSTMPATVFIYLSPTGALVAGYGAGLTLACSGCIATSNVTSFPLNSVPLFTWVAGTEAGKWDASGTDYRAAFSSTVIEPGVGLARTYNPVNGSMTLSVDTIAVGRKVPAPSSATSVCTPGQWALSLDYAYYCVAANTWKRAALATW